MYDTHLIFLGSQLLNAYVKYTLKGIEQMVKCNERTISENTRTLESLGRTLEMMKQKQEMVLTKHDQLHFTLHGETSVNETPALFVSPPLTSPTQDYNTKTVRSYI